MGERARGELRWTHWQYMPSTRREIVRRGALDGWLILPAERIGSVLISSTSKPQSSIVLVTVETRDLLSTRRVAELVMRLTTTSETPGRLDSISVMVATQEEQVMPPTERVIWCEVGSGVVSDEERERASLSVGVFWQREHCWRCLDRFRGRGGRDSLRISKPASSRAAWMRERERPGGRRRVTDL